MLSRYDVIAVLCGGLRRDADGFRPASLTDSDEHGMLGGDLPVAAAELWRAGRAGLFLFSTGVSERSRARFGPAVPPEAVVYADHFRAETGADPAVLVGTDSVNTAGNVAAVARLAAGHGWREVAILSSEYHLPRAREVLRQHGGLAAEFLSAEAVLMAARPGSYEAQIGAAYGSPAGRKRTASERQGLADLCAGRYDRREHHLGGAGAGFHPPGHSAVPGG